jgi:hypothetical protein
MKQDRTDVYNVSVEPQLPRDCLTAAAQAAARGRTKSSFPAKEERGWYGELP